MREKKVIWIRITISSEGLHCHNENIYGTQTQLPFVILHNLLLMWNMLGYIQLCWATKLRVSLMCCTGNLWSCSSTFLYIHFHGLAFMWCRIFVVFFLLLTQHPLFLFCVHIYNSYHYYYSCSHFITWSLRKSVAPVSTHLANEWTDTCDIMYDVLYMTYWSQTCAPHHPDIQSWPGGCSLARSQQSDGATR